MNTDINTTVRVLNLAQTVDASDLEDMFSTIGNVRSARVAKGVGFVQMSSPSEMQDCVDHFHGQVKDGLIMMVQEDKPYVPKPLPFKISKKKSS